MQIQGSDKNRNCNARSCGHLTDPQDGGGERHHGEVVSGCFLVACGDAPELLELGEAALNEVALLVELPIEGVLGGPGRVVGDHRLGVHGGDDDPDVIGIIGGVGEHDLGALALDQGGGLGRVAFVTARQVEGDRATKASHGQMDLSAQAAA